MGEHQPAADPSGFRRFADRLAGGERDAASELLARYAVQLVGLARRRLGTRLRSKEDPEDVLQETMMIAVRKLSELEVRTPSSIMQWLAKIADYQIKNKLDYLRAEKRDSARERRLKTDDASTDSSVSGIVVPFQGPTPSQYYARTELEGLIDSQLEQLDPPDYREVILMRDYYELDWEAIRESLGRPSAEAVQDLYHRAHKRLRERMRHYLR